MQIEGHESTVALENTCWLDAQTKIALRTRTHTEKKTVSGAIEALKRFEVDLNLTEITFTFCGSTVTFEN